MTGMDLGAAKLNDLVNFISAYLMTAAGPRRGLNRDLSCMSFLSGKSNRDRRRRLEHFRRH